MDVQAMIELLGQQPLWLGLSCLGAASLIEYLFPPFPGDAILLAGAMLIPIAQWPFVAVLAAVTLGSVLGAALNWRLGRWLATTTRTTWLHRWLERPKVAPRVRALEARFARRGSLYVSLNRFMPGFRAFFFIIAGKVNLPLGKVLAFGALSATLWGLALMGVGYSVGYNVERVVSLLKTYNVIVWGILGALLFVFCGRALWLKISGRSSASA